jgi:hypothetical protein
VNSGSQHVGGSSREGQLTKNEIAHLWNGGILSLSD